jgi:chemotaxis protein MotB
MARRRKHAAHGEIHADERWLITYADMITLLLAVFIVLYALSDTNVRKFTAFAQSVSAAFSTDVFQGSQPTTITDGADIAPSVGNFDSGSGAISTDFKTVNASVSDYVIGKGLDGQVSVDQVPEGIAIRIKDALLFQPGRAALDDRSTEVLQRISATLSGYPNHIRIEGNTDDVAPTGPFYTDNWHLSTARALAVLDVLVQAGIDPARLSAAGRAQFNPLLANTSEANRATNRRVDILILYPPTTSPAASDGGTPGATATNPPFSIPVPGVTLP